jgi:PKD domain-containing protein
MKKLALACVLACLAGGGLPAAVQAASPRVQAVFTYSPALPFTGDVVTFTSTSTAPGNNNQIVSQRWDLDADGSFDDGTTASVTYSFAGPGTYWVSLFVLDKHGDWDIGSQMLTVQSHPPPAPPPPPELMSPFPVVQLAGSVTRKGVRIRRFTVQAPPGASIAVSCRGRSCPFHKQAKTAATQPHAGHDSATTPGVVRIHRLERRLRAGAVVKLFITKPGTIGKYTRLKIRKGKAPARADLCLYPGKAEPEACPSS